MRIQLCLLISIAFITYSIEITNTTPPRAPTEASDPLKFPLLYFGTGSRFQRFTGPPPSVTHTRRLVSSFSAEYCLIGGIHLWRSFGKLEKRGFAGHGTSYLIVRTFSIPTINKSDYTFRISTHEPEATDGYELEEF